jgi:hypothetical protein
MERKPAYGIEELAKAGPLRRTYLYKAIKEKKLKAQKAGRRTIITHENFEAFLCSLPVVGEQGKAERAASPSAWPPSRTGSPSDSAAGLDVRKSSR